MSYVSQKRPLSPAGMSVALAINGAIIIAVALSPITARRLPDTSIDVFNIPKPAVPKPVVDDSQPRKRAQATADSPPIADNISKQRNADPVIDDQPSGATGSFGPDGGTDSGSGDGGATGDGGVKTDSPPVDPPKPVFKPAVRDSKLTKEFQPEYPARLITQEVEGSATVRVLVGGDGRVKQAEIVKATHPEFGKATVRQALKAWRFRPATSDGKPVEDWVTLTVTFVLDR